MRFAFELLVAAALAFTAFAADTAILTADLRSPTCFLAGGDAVAYAAMHFKATLDNGGYLHNPFIGAPGGAFLEDFPAPDFVYLGLLQLLTALTRDWVLTWNLFVMAGYPLAGAAAFAVVRGYGVRLVPALVASVLWAVLPFHQYRLYGHISLGFSYGLVPIALVPAIEVLRGATPFVDCDPMTGRWSIDVRNRSTVVVFLAAVLTGLWGFLYFMVFAVLALATAGFARSVQTRSVLPLVRSGLSSGITAAVFALSNLHVIRYVHDHGRTRLGLRYPEESEVFGLKLVQLLLPIPDHRIGAFRDVRVLYDMTAPLRNENGSAALGLVGATGMAILFVRILRGPDGPAAGSLRGSFAPSMLLWPLTVLNATTFLIGTIGGLGAIVAYAGFPEVRCYNRISVLIAFYALFALAILADLAIERASSGLSRGLLNASFGFVGLFGVLDQTPPDSPRYDLAAQSFREDRAFVREVEERLPPGIDVLQLPYMRFPENGPREHLEDYAHFLGYLHSERLRFSYGTIRGRLGDARYRELGSMAPSALVDAAVVAGYRAIWLDARGYDDQGSAVATALTERLGPPLATSPNVRVWALEDAAVELRARLGASYDARVRAWNDRLHIAFEDGFYVEEQFGDHRWVFGRSKAKAFITNPTDHVIDAVLSFDTTTADREVSADLFVDGALMHARIRMTGTRQPFAHPIRVPPGTHVITFRTDAPLPRLSPIDVRFRAFVLDEPQLRVP